MSLTDARLAESAARHERVCVCSRPEIAQLVSCDLGDLLAEVGRLRAGLVALEWAHLDWMDRPRCRFCDYLKYQGHAPGCALAALIGGTDG